MTNPDPAEDFALWLGGQLADPAVPAEPVDHEPPLPDPAEIFGALAITPGPAFDPSAFGTFLEAALSRSHGSPSGWDEF